MSLVETIENVVNNLTRATSIRRFEVAARQPRPADIDPDVFENLETEPIAWGERWLECDFEVLEQQGPSEWVPSSGFLTWGQR